MRERRSGNAGRPLHNAYPERGTEALVTGPSCSVPKGVVPLPPRAVRCSKVTSRRASRWVDLVDMRSASDRLRREQHAMAKKPTSNTDAEILGTTKEDGTDREQRDRSREV